MADPVHPNSSRATLAALIEDIAETLGVDLRTRRGRTLATRMHDAWELGKLSPTAVHQVVPSETPVHAGDKAGMVVSVAHTVSADKIAEHGPEVAMTAYLRQCMRELAANGARPEKSSSYEVVGMLDGTIVVTAEGTL